MKTIIYGGDIITMKDEEVHEAVVINDEKILYLGNLEECKKKFPNSKMKDLKGKTLMPGFIDTHCHLSFAGEMKSQKSLFELTNIKDILDAISEEVKKYKPGEPVFINGYEGKPITDKRDITLEEMDNVAPDNPLVIMTAGTHASFVNSKALEIVGDRLKEENIELTKEQKNTGKLTDEANLLAFSLPAKLMSVEQRNKIIRNIIEECSSNGITSAHSMEGRELEDDPDLIYLSKVIDKLPFNLIVYSQTTNPNEVKKYGYKQIGGCFKCILDGDVDPKTAAFIDPYIGEPDNYGNLYFSDEDLYDFFISSHKEDMQICIHAIGDAAIDQALRTYEKILKEYPRDNHRHRIEHFEISNTELINKAKELDIALSMHPVFDYYWPYEDYIPYIGEERSRQRCNLRAVIDKGITVGGGSDAPVTSMNPFLGIHAAVNHSVETSRISTYEALRMYTIDAAYLGFEEERVGSIEVGKEANFAIISDNPLKIDSNLLDQIKVLETIYKGETVWKMS